MQRDVEYYNLMVQFSIKEEDVEEVQIRNSELQIKLKDGTIIKKEGRCELPPIHVGG